VTGNEPDARDARESSAIDDALRHADIAHLTSRLASHRPLEASSTSGRLAAVAAVLRVTSEVDVLFIKRAEAEHDPWSGHVAFPGGRHEPDDVTLRDTAIRETWEELSLDLTRGRVLGQLDDLSPRAAGLPAIVIRPFVALVSPNVTFELSREVAAAFWVPLSALRAIEANVEHELMEGGVGRRFPAYAVQGHIVWGLTERIVRQLLSLFDS
jgi:8-oxo-dGTP pyrophosphatase MutT (NUDIX family)